MTREEAFKKYEKWEELGFGHSTMPESEVLYMAMDALRPVTREQVEKVRGEWIIEDAGDGDRRKKCSLCNQPISGWWGRDRFCANCGAPMTDKAVDMVMERLEALHGDL